MNNLGVAFVGTLRQDHLHKLRNHVHVRVLQIPLLECSHASASAWNIRNGIARRLSLCKEISTDGIKPARIGERSQLNRAKLCWSCLSWYCRRHNAVLRDRDRGCIRRDRNRWQQGIAISCNYQPLIVLLEISGTSISNCAIRLRDLKKSRALNREIERVVRLVEVSLRHDHF